MILAGRCAGLGGGRGFSRVVFVFGRNLGASLGEGEIGQPVSFHLGSVRFLLPVAEPPTLCPLKVSQGSKSSTIPTCTPSLPSQALTRRQGLEAAAHGLKELRLILLQPRTASMAPVSANGRAKIECSNFIISGGGRSAGTCVIAPLTVHAFMHPHVPIMAKACANAQV